VSNTYNPMAPHKMALWSSQCAYHSLIWYSSLLYFECFDYMQFWFCNMHLNFPLRSCSYKLQSGQNSPQYGLILNSAMVKPMQVQFIHMVFFATMLWTLKLSAILVLQYASEFPQVVITVSGELHRSMALCIE